MAECVRQLIKTTFTLPFMLLREYKESLGVSMFGFPNDLVGGCERDQRGGDRIRPLWEGVSFPIELGPGKATLDFIESIPAIQRGSHTVGHVTAITWPLT